MLLNIVIQELKFLVGYIDLEGKVSYTIFKIIFNLIVFNIFTMFYNVSCNQPTDDNQNYVLVN